MGEQRSKKNISVGLLAHVDAGKTTLAEATLYMTGSIRKLGRVDHQDAFLDNFALERSRGITIFSKQAEVMLDKTPMTLLDTPGHVDFSAEMERTLQILDYAVLVISGADGVQGHVETLWRLLQRYSIPTFLFVNKMDQVGVSRIGLMNELTKRLDSRCVDFGPMCRMNLEKAIAKAEGQKTPEQRVGKFRRAVVQKFVPEEDPAEQTDELFYDLDDCDEEFLENIAVCDEELMEKYLETAEISVEDVQKLIAERKIFPCFFGSALKIVGVAELLEGIRTFSTDREYPKEFGARVFKITRDVQGNRLTHMKITGGNLKVKTVLSNNPAKESEHWEEKVDQIRIYSGSGFRMINEVQAGMVCAVTGLEKTYAGEGLGIEESSEGPVLEPVLSYRIQLPEDCDVHQAFLKLRVLEEEEPQLHIVWDEQLQEIHAQLMGEVQIEVLKNIILNRFGMQVEFGTGNIVYKETICSPVEGVGHYEPLRHYAEVHLLLEPGERGSGLQFEADCSEDILDRNWQRLILTHLEEKKHRGVLTGAEITDMKITLLTGRAHLKHTEGGDFRQATYRAVRHGLRCAESMLLEPIYEFRLEVPAENIGRAMADVQKMCGSFESPEIDGDMAVLTGTAPVVNMRGYQTEVISYTRGRGRMFTSLKGYEECHNAEEVIEICGYDPEADLENPTSSVFCAHGAGFVVNWYEVRDYMHLEGWDAEKGMKDPAGQNDEFESLLRSGMAGQSGKNIGSNETSDKHACEEGEFEADEWMEEESEEAIARRKLTGGTKRRSYSSAGVTEEELEAIFTKTYGKTEQKRKHFLRSHKEDYVSGHGTRTPRKPAGEEVLLVDGYNIIFAWEELKEIAKDSIDGARGRLMDMLSNYQGYKKNHLIVVFDAYKVEGGMGSVQKYHNIHVIFTKEAETADQYIEKTVREIGKKYNVTVATSDALEQIIILGAGAARMSASDLYENIQLMSNELRETYLQPEKGSKNYLFDHLSEELTEVMEAVRLGEQEL